MSALAIANLLNALALLIPGLLQAAQEIGSTASATDQATVDAAIASFTAAATAHLTQAEADLDAAAKAP